MKLNIYVRKFPNFLTFWFLLLFYLDIFSEVIARYELISHVQTSRDSLKARVGFGCQSNHFEKVITTNLQQNTPFLKTQYIQIYSFLYKWRNKMFMAVQILDIQTHLRSMQYTIVEMIQVYTLFCCNLIF